MLSTAGSLAAERSITTRTWSWVLLAAVGAALATAAGLASVYGLDSSAGSRLSQARAAIVPSTQPRSLQMQPLAAGATLSDALGRAPGAYQVHGEGAWNPAQGLRIGFTSAGVSVASGAARLELSLAAVGRAGASRPMSSSAPLARANRVVYSRAGVREWFANGPLGLEQGFTVAWRPAGAGPLLLSSAVSGSLTGRLSGGAVRFSGQGHTLSYGGLSVLDARGAHVRSWLSLVDRRLLIYVDDRRASYPLRIDPFIQGEHVGAYGNIALSADGNTALIGGSPEEASSTGSAFVFTRSGETWTEQAELTGGGEVGKAKFGETVALSANGNTALVGGGDDNSEIGAAWVFTRSGSTWTQQGAKLTGVGATAHQHFGRSVALSSDGNTALIGSEQSLTGGAWVFTRSGETWTQQGKELIGSGKKTGFFGDSVALSGDGNTALMGGLPFSKGAVWVFTRSGETWTQQGKMLRGMGEKGNAGFGTSGLALSANGSTALVGAAYDHNMGAAFVLTRSGSTWTQQGSKLTGSATKATSRFGASVTLSADGNTALIGAPGGEVKTFGEAYVFGRAGETWTQQQELLNHTPRIGDLFATYVVLSAEATTALLAPGGEPGEGVVAWVLH